MKQSPPELPQGEMAEGSEQGKPSEMPATTFTRFPDLPKEIQLSIIRFAHLIPRLVEVRWPEYAFGKNALNENNEEVYNWGIKLLRSPWAQPPALLQVSRKFRDEGLKIRPLTLAMRDYGITYNARLRFNFDLDTLVIPNIYLQGTTRTFEGQQGIQKLVVAYGDHGTPWSAIIETAYHLHDRMESLTESIKILHRKSLDRRRCLTGRDPSDGWTRTLEEHPFFKKPFFSGERAVVDEIELMSWLHDGDTIVIPLDFDPELLYR